MAEFAAHATTYVGNFSGPCLIYLNGESITVKRSDRLEVAKWPYIVIRQFRAEEEAGRFSFVSGRRGPYGVAEYNFMLNKGMLNELQEALTQFTGAKFSGVAPGSGSGENPPPVPSTHRPSLPNALAPSPSMTSLISTASYDRGRGSMDAGHSPSMTSLISTASYDRARSSMDAGHSLSMTSLISTTSSDRGRGSLDTGYMRGGQHHLLTGPRLPPRDYLPPTLQMSPPTRSEDSRYIRTPGDTRNLPESSDYIIPDRPPQPLPSSPPTLTKVHDPYTSTHSPHHRVMTSSAYQTGRPHLKPKPSGVKGPSPPPLEEGTAVDPPHLPPKPALLSPPSEGTYSVPKESGNKSRYDHITLSQEEGEQVPTSPQPDPIIDEPDTTNLDFGSRNSPLLRSRSGTPGETTPTLHHLHSVDEDGEIFINNSPTIRGRRSPDNKLKRSQTEKVISPPLIAPETYDVPPNRLVKQCSADDRMFDSHYHVPKPMSNSEYGIPRPHNDPRNDNGYYHQPTPTSQTYKVPIPYSRNGTETYDSPKHTNKPEEQKYKVPIPHTRNGTETYDSPKHVNKPVPIPHARNGTETYDSPKHMNKPEEQLYSSSKSVNGNRLEVDTFYGNVATSAQPQQEDLYNMPRATMPDLNASNLYNIPPRRGSSGKINDTNSTDGGTPPRLHKLRPARSAESLFTRRINPNGMNSHISTPAITNEHNMYVDIEQNRELSTGDNLYAEIPANYIPRRSQLGGNANQNSSVPLPSLSSQQPKSGSEQYDQLPSRMGSQIQKQRELARDGYEYCGPAEVNPNSFNTMTLPPRSKLSSASPPSHRRDRGTSLDKYDIQMPNTRPARPRSEADLLDGTEFQKANGMDVLGSSIPNESSFLVADEYVIVTSRDTRQKFSATEPQGIPGADTQSTNQSEEYQVMSAVKINRSQLLYDTPNPSLSSSNGNPLQSEPTAEYGNISHDLVQDAQYDTVNPANYTRLNSESSLDMDGFSPKRSKQIEKVKNLPVSSLSNVFSEQEADADGQSDHVTLEEGVAIPQKDIVKIACGSPQDATVSLELKNRTRSHGNVLDQDSAKRHSYINVSGGDRSSQSIEQKIRDSTLTTAAFMKRPKPLPKPASFDASVMEETPSAGGHGYAWVDLEKVKGNAHPLSTSAETLQKLHSN